MRIITLTSVCLLDGCDIEAASIVQGTAEISGGVVRTTSLTSIATITSPTFGISSGIHDLEFIQAGAGHALELSTVGTTVTLTGIIFSGYGATTSDAAAIDVTAVSGTTTINWTGGSAPTYKTAGATVVVQNVVTVTLTGLKDNTEIRVYDAGTVTEVAGIEDAVTGTSDDRSFAFSLDATTPIDIRIIHGGVAAADGLFYQNQVLKGYVVPSSAASLPIQQVRDRNYYNP